MPTPRAVIVGGDPLTRAGLAALLADRSEVAVAAGLAPAERQRLATLQADVVLWDAGSSEPSDCREIAAALPVVALVAGEAQAHEALGAGARAVVFRDAGADRLAAALAAAARGLLALESSLSSWIRPPAPPAAELEALTPREAEVLALLSEGLPNKTIAQRLGVTERTAKFHVESILAKLGAESRSEAIVIAARRGMITL